MAAAVATAATAAVGTLRAGAGAGAAASVITRTRDSGALLAVDGRTVAQAGGQRGTSSLTIE
jgi:hypothetical protein